MTRSIPSGSGPRMPHELGDGAAGAGCDHGVGIGDRPGPVDRRHHDGRVEHAEGGGDDLATNLAEDPATAREVGDAVGELHATPVGLGPCVALDAARRPARSRGLAYASWASGAK